MGHSVVETIGQSVNCGGQVEQSCGESDDFIVEQSVGMLIGQLVTTGHSDVFGGVTEGQSVPSGGQIGHCVTGHSVGITVGQSVVLTHSTGDEVGHVINGHSVGMVSGGQTGQSVGMTIGQFVVDITGHSVTSGQSVEGQSQGEGVEVGQEREGHSVVIPSTGQIGHSVGITVGQDVELVSEVVGQGMIGHSVEMGQRLQSSESVGTTVGHSVEIGHSGIATV